MSEPLGGDAVRHPIDLTELTRLRCTDPGAVDRAWAARRPHTGGRERLLVVAADHPARGALGVRSDPMAMASRADLLRRLATALANPRVDGVLGSADVLEDLLLLGLLDDKLVFGSMNRGGLQGAGFEFDDPAQVRNFDSYTAEDFIQIVPDQGLDLDSHPDFSGEVMQFAFGVQLTSTGQSGLGTVTSAIGWDNLSLRMQVVPAPGATALLVGAGLVGMRRRR